MLDRDARWPELLPELQIDAAKQTRRDELLLALLAAIGGFCGLLMAAGCLVWASAPPPLLRPAEGLMLLARVAAVVPLPAVLGGRLALQLG